MNNFKKVLYVGHSPAWSHSGRPISARTFVEVVWENGNLSLHGVVGPFTNGNCAGSCGQIQDTLKETKPDADLSQEQLAKLHELWERWHLNDLTAGSPDQEAFLRMNPVQFEYPQSHYDAAKTALAEAGLNPDPNYMYKGKPYNYGHAWLNEPVPEDVIEWLHALPDASETPAWV